MIGFSVYGLSILDILMIAAYFAILMSIGYWSSRRIKSSEDYFLAGRRLGKFIQVFAAFGQGTSAENAIEGSVKVARNGIAGLWQDIIWTIGMPINWIFSIWYRRMRVLTLGDFFVERYGSVRMAGFYAVTSSVFYMIVVGLGFTCMTKAVSGILVKPPEKLTAVESAEYERALDLESLEAQDVKTLTADEIKQMEQLRFEDPRKEFPYIPELLVMTVVAVVVILYAVGGGLEAAFVSNVMQGFAIMILSVILIPFAAVRINRLTNTGGLQGIVDAARSLLPAGFFEIWGSPLMADFTWYFIVALTVMLWINVFVLANQVTATGSAKDEYIARVGFTTGMYIKRTCLLLWGVTALLLVILYKGVVRNPDYIWGCASRDLLGTAGFGLVGLMIACLMAAVMSTASALTITAAGLMTHNFFKETLPAMSEKAYVWVGRAVGVVVIVGGALIATKMRNVYFLLELMWEFNIVMAAAFLMGLKWRRATRIGAWASALTAAGLFFILPLTIPLLPGVRTYQPLLKTTEPIVMARTYVARQADVDARNQQIAEWQRLNAMQKTLGPCPEPLEKAQRFDLEYRTPRRSIFWRQEIKAGENGILRGYGLLNIELFIVDQLGRIFGYDLANNPHALNKTIRILIRTFLPFVVVIVVSLLTRPDSKERLDRFFVKMKTPVQGDRNADLRELELSYQNPQRFDHKKMFANSDIEIEKFDSMDNKGILIYSAWGLAILGLFFLIVFLGRH